MIWRWVWLVAVLVASGVASAACKEYRAGTIVYEGSQWHRSPGAACQEVADIYDAHYPDGVYSNWHCENVTETSGRIAYVWNGSPRQGDSVTIVSRDAECTCDTSDPTIGQTWAGSADTMATQSYCHAVSQCKVAVQQTVSANGEVLYVGVHTAQACEEDAPTVQSPDPENEVQPHEACTQQGEYQVCVNASGTGQCGYVNDNYVCLSKVPDRGCIGFADGDKVCRANAGTPPAPDSGVPGQVAEPDAVIERSAGGGATNTYYYYSSTTVSGSVRDPNASGGTVQGPDGGIGGDEEGEGESGCSEGADCSGTLPDGGEFEAVDSFGQLTQAFWTRVSHAPIVEAVSDLGQSMPEGECPELTFEMWDQELDLAASMCSIWESIAPILSAAMLVAWGLLAARIVLSA